MITKILYNLSDDYKNEAYLYIIKPSKDDGFNLPIELLIPKKVLSTNLLYAGRTPKSYRNASLDEAIKMEEEISIKKKFNISKVSRSLYLKYGMPIVSPIIPRFINLQASYLTYDVYHNKFVNVKELNKSEIEKFYNLDEQIANMIKYAIKFLRENGYKIEDKIIMEGYSAASKLCSGFAVLHPELIKGLILGGTGGLTTLPIKKYKDAKLDYPLGVYDISNFNLEEYKKIKEFQFIGSDDYNDLAALDYETKLEGNKMVPILDSNGNKIYKKDKNGYYMPYYSGGHYTDEEITIIHKILGTNPQARFDNQIKIFDDLNMDVTFKKYSGNHKTVFDDERLYDDICKFYENISLEKSVDVKKKNIK